MGKSNPASTDSPMGKNNPASTNSPMENPRETDRQSASAVQRACSVLASICLVFLILASGFLVCALPDQTTRLLAGNTSIANPSLGFSRDSMVSVACATRDYSFGSHDRLVLQQAIYDANVQAQNDAPAARAYLNAPNLNSADRNDIDSLDAAFDRASERFCYSREAISHLDDCFALATFAYTLIAAGAVAFALFLFGARTKQKRALAIRRAGWATLALFAVLGLWAAIDFDGLFTQFHRVFFSQGNWTFPADSLLICALPTDFWMRMGLVWLVTSVIASILSILIGNALSSKARAA